jgi:wyosine [tRNA(Phe)-imidazoG37] synthetase (radical SAM superfamily)
MSKFVLDYSSSTLNKKLHSVEEKIGAAILMYASTKAIEYESYMKLNRPWKDRSHQAKVTLNTKVSQPNSHTVRITLAHGVEYGIWLELAHEKRYAIIGPTIDAKGTDLVNGMQNIFNKIKL